MVILGLAEDRADLKKRLARILVVLSFDDKPITAADLGATGAMAALLKDAIKPQSGSDDREHTGVDSYRSFCQHRSWHCFYYRHQCFFAFS